MSALPPSAADIAGASDSPAAEPGFEESTWERRARNRAPSVRFIGWRLRALVAAALIGCLGMFLLLRLLAAQPALQARLVVNDESELKIAGEPRCAALAALLDPQGRAQPVDAALMQRSARWLARDQDRERQARQQAQLAAALASGHAVSFVDTTGATQAVAVAPRGAAGLGWLFWLLCTLALLLYLVTMVVLLSRPDTRNALFALMALAQTGNLVFLAALSTPTLGWPAGFMHWERDLRAGFDLVTAGALVHVTNLHPRRLPGGALRSALAWAAVAAVIALVVSHQVSHEWWWTQATALTGAAVTLAQLAWMQRRQPHPLALHLLRFCGIAALTLALLTAIVAALGPALDSQGQAAAIGSTVWVVFLAAMLLMLPFLSRTQALMREFSLLAGVSTVATALDLLFVALFSLGNFASLTLALFISLGLYAGARQWLVARMLARERLTTERMFELVYRMAREVQRQPRATAAQLSQLLRELFDPLDVQPIARGTQRARVVAEGSNLVVPVPAVGQAEGEDTRSIMLGFAGRGRRLFTEDDARLADRIVELVSRAVAYDRAVERGRSEERVRIAQDLHDDIGARLLTLMYKAPTPEMEDYLRHTLKDLKTLTRGLAAPNHPLSHAVAEWKADIQQRVQAADCELVWAFAIDRDIELSVVQWSALTRVLRELVSNVLAHGRATHLEIRGGLAANGALSLTVTDNGHGRAPEAWSPGLGLGGVRKRVRQLGGDVAWRENTPRGIVCEVKVPKLSST
jgi:signal transduction histidine kinase